MLCPADLTLSTHFLRFVQSSECEWIAVLRVTRGTHQFSLDFLSKWLEISCTSRYRGFESHSLRHQEPVIKPITGSFLFPKRAIPCSFTFSERKSSVLPNINRSPPAFEVAALRQSKPCLHRLCRGDLGLVIQMAVNIRRRANIAVTQPLLDLLQRHIVCQKQ